MIEYILGFIVIIFFGREIYNRSQKRKLTKQLSYTQRELDKEQLRNVSEKVTNSGDTLQHMLDEYDGSGGKA